MRNTHRSKQSAVPKQLKMKPEVFTHIRDTIGNMRAEQGGILGGCRNTGEVNFFFFDDTGEQSGVSYTPNIATLNTVIKKHWKPNGIQFMGSIHTHPPLINHLSAGDEVYAKKILDAMTDLPYLLAPIALTVPDAGSFSLFPYAVTRDGDSIRIVEQELVVGGEIVTFEQHGVPEFDYEVFFPKDILAALGLAAIGVTGLAGARFITSRLRRNRKAEQ